MPQTTDEDLVRILEQTKTIALVGASPKDNRPSHQVMAYLQAAGYKLLPVNPGQVGKLILGEPVFAHLRDIPGPVDMIDIFRRPDFVGEVVQEAISIKARCIWMQLRIVNEEAACEAREAGLDVVMDRCTKIEHARLIG